MARVVDAASDEAVRQSLSVDDWAEAALDALALGGLSAVAVEPLARRLGVTKGSFYWHFANREALLLAALRRWEAQETDEIIARAQSIADPYERIVQVFKHANSSVRAGRLNLALAAASDHAGVQAFVRRVSERRLSFLRQCYEALGLDAEQARLWSTFALATFVGNLQVRRDLPEAVPAGAEFSQYVRLMIRTLIPRHPRALAAVEPPTSVSGVTSP